MKYLRKWKLFENHQDIHEVCKKYGIENYTINEDESIDVEGNVYLNNKGLTKIPLNFNRVSGFSCDDNQLTNLEGAPKEVDGSFSCRNNQLTSLEGAPQEVDGYFSCRNNKLTTLKGGPQEVGGDFDCAYSQLTSLEGSPKEVGGYFSCGYNRLTTLEGSPQEVGGNFTCYDNKLTNLEHLPNISGIIDMYDNPIFYIVGSWINNPEGRWEKWEYFQDLSIIRDNKVILPRLEEFHEVMDIKMPNLEEVKKYYKIIE
jgi:hypothetical protein